MSGGVDSSVAAGLLIERGYRVTGVFLCLGSAGGDNEESRGCCSVQDAADARRVADRLGMDLYVLDRGREFEEIIANFAAEYSAGRTPNPCIHCNSRIKIGRLIAHADALGIDYVATGHYARLADGGGGPAIHRGLNRSKDQSYALFALARGHLGRLMLPIGELPNKTEVRRIARVLGLPVHDKPDSQDICFVARGDLADLLRRRQPQAMRPGNIVDSSGKVLGRHDGFCQFTIGQRHGLGVAGGIPLYVTHINPASAEVTIGPRSEAMGSRLRAENANWHCDLPGGEFRATVQVRYNHSGVTGTVRAGADGSFEVQFDEPVLAITPGQAAVVYDDQRLLGGGWIC